jgi:hypothetical protein
MALAVLALLLFWGPPLSIPLASAALALGVVALRVPDRRPAVEAVASPPSRLPVAVVVVASIALTLSVGVAFVGVLFDLLIPEA